MTTPSSGLRDCFYAKYFVFYPKIIAQQLAEQKGRRRNQLSRHGEANVCETRADAQEPAAQTRRLAARVGVSSAPRSASSRSHSLLAELAVVSLLCARPPPAMLAEWRRAIAARRRWRARLAWRDAETSRIRAPEPRSSVRRSLSHSCPTLRRPRLPWRVSSSGGARRVGLMHTRRARGRRCATWWGHIDAGP